MVFEHELLVRLIILMPGSDFALKKQVISCKNVMLKKPAKKRLKETMVSAVWTGK